MQNEIQYFLSIATQSWESRVAATIVEVCERPNRTTPLGLTANTCDTILMIFHINYASVQS